MCITAEPTLAWDQHCVLSLEVMYVRYCLNKCRVHGIHSVSVAMVLMPRPLPLPLDHGAAYDRAEHVHGVRPEHAHQYIRV